MLMQFQSLGQENSLEEKIATHSSILAWKIPWTEEPGGLQSMQLQSQTQLSAHECAHTHNILLYIFTTSSLSVPPLMDI